MLKLVCFLRNLQKKRENDLIIPRIKKAKFSGHIAYRYIAYRHIARFSNLRWCNFKYARQNNLHYPMIGFVSLENRLIKVVKLLYYGH